MKFRTLMLAAFTLGAISSGSILLSLSVSARSADRTARRIESVRNIDKGDRATVPFKGTFQGSDTTIPPNIITTGGTGEATHMGRFSLAQRVELNFAELTDAGTAQWVAANGDAIETEVAGEAVFNETGDGVIITETHTISGGTGRFEGSTGIFVVVRTHLFALSDDGTHVTFGWFEGDITSPGAAE